MTLLILAAVLVRFPLAASCLAFFAVPFAGNHPGGRYLELLHLPVAAAALGLALRAQRERLPLPSGGLWRASAAVVATSTLALAPVLPAVIVRAAQANDPALALVQALVAAEGDPLYSLGSFVQLVLCVLWATTLRWAGAGLSFARNAIRSTLAGLVAVMTLGALGFHSLVDLRRWWFDLVDPNLFFHDPMQSIFWNPGWLAGYFALAFGLCLGLVWLEPPPRRWVVALLLAACWGYFLMSRQRAGLVAAVTTLTVFGGLSVSGLPRARRRVALLAGAGILVGALAVSASLTSGPWRTGASRLLTDARLDENRSRLWRAAWVMWRDSPVFGIGEGAFCWRFRDFVPHGSELDVPFIGDAHNTWLQALTTRGLLGLAAFVWLAMAVAREVHRALAGAGTSRGLGIGLAAALSGALVYSSVQHLFYVQGLQVLFWGIVALASLGGIPEPSRSPRPAWRGALALLGLALLAAGVASAAPRWTGLAADLAREPRGFYPMRKVGEDVQRWSSRRGVLCLYPGGPVVRLTVNPGQRPPHLLPVEVTFLVGDRLVDHLSLAEPGRRDVLLAVPEGASLGPPSPPAAFGECHAGTPALRLQVRVSSVWSRMITRGFEDYRHLGVAIGPGREPR
jgi:O-antigen ligase